jgi:hypothetical protein
MREPLSTAFALFAASREIKLVGVGELRQIRLTPRRHAPKGFAGLHDRRVR